MKEVEDDVGNTTAHRFHPFVAQNIRRIENVHALKLPDDAQFEKIKRLQSFLKLSDRTVEPVNSKCLWVFRTHAQYALYAHIAAALRKSPRETIATLKLERFDPVVRKHHISEVGPAHAQVTYHNTLTTAIFDFLTEQLYPLADYAIGPTLLSTLDQLVELAERLGVVGPDGARFSLSMQDDEDTELIVENYILSSIKICNAVDTTRLNKLLSLLGINADWRKNLLRKIGELLYMNHMRTHNEGNIHLSNFDELAHLHDVFGLGPDNLREIVTEYRKVGAAHAQEKILGHYHGAAGLGELLGALPFVEGESVTAYYRMEKERKADWMVNLLTDLVQSERHKLDDYLQFARDGALAKLAAGGPVAPELERAMAGEDPLGHSLAEIIALATDKLELRGNEFLEACFLFAFEHSEPLLDEVAGALEMKRLARSSDRWYRYAPGEPPRDSQGDNWKRQSPYAPKKAAGDRYEAEVLLRRHVHNLFKTLCLCPEGQLNFVRDVLALADTRPLRRFVETTAHTEDERRDSLLLVHKYLEK